MQLCWWCCHSIPKSILRLPISFDVKSKTFKGIGQFCSFPCMRAYNNDNSKLSGQKYTSKMLIAQLIQTSQKSALLDVPNAPPRESLTRFGGKLSIEEFRSHSGAIELTLPQITKVDYDIERSQKTTKSLSETGNPVGLLCTSFKDTKVINNPLKIKKKNVNDSKNHPQADSILCMLNNIKNPIDENPNNNK